MRYFPSGPRSTGRAGLRRPRSAASPCSPSTGISLWAAVEKLRRLGWSAGAGCSPSRSRAARRWRLAYLIARTRWGRGLATEAALAIRDHGFHQLGLG